MPRVHINLHDIDEIEELEDQADWENLIGVNVEQARRDVRPAADSRGRRERRFGDERRFGGADALDRKRTERRKSISRPIKRI
jgi:hypothetical protein